MGAPRRAPLRLLRRCRDGVHIYDLRVREYVICGYAARIS
jgi:hypothetical protein